jgi:DsbC/DsbD-like thiol-disulfide interchange protein
MECMPAMVATLIVLGVAGVPAGQEPPPVPAPGTPARVSRSTPHLTFTAEISPAVVKPGGRMSIAIDIVPRKNMHVYAPGTPYRPVSMRLHTDAPLRVHGAVFPKPRRYLFKPLKEEVLVYDAPFRLTVKVVAGDAQALRKQRRGPDLTIKGSLDYQACDDRICYLPTSVPFEWTLKIAARTPD